MKPLSIQTLQAYLGQKYKSDVFTTNLFMKLVEEIGEVAEALNKQSGRKDDDGLSSLAEELADVIHYTLAIAAVQKIDLASIILEKDIEASIKYQQTPNLTEFLESE